MDFTTPIGKVILATLGAFAEYYSDNLSLETKKGKRERKAQGGGESAFTPAISLVVALQAALAFVDELGGKPGSKK